MTRHVIGIGRPAAPPGAAACARLSGGRGLAAAGIVAVWWMSSAAVAAAQPRPADPAAAWQAAIAGSEDESYLGALQVAGVAPATVWSIRPLSPVQTGGASVPATGHPWAGRLASARGDGSWRRPRVAADAGAIYNSAFAFSVDDGAVWAGRGMTAVASAVAEAVLGPVTVRLAPVAFRSENRPFALIENGRAGRGAFADPIAPDHVDAPQRFGDAAYQRLDWGQSSVRVDLRGVSLGLSTGNQVWGPATYHPIVLGANAPGFAHAFLGTARPTNVGIGRVHARFEVGRLAESGFSTIPGDSADRLMVGAVAVATLRGVPGLEIGGARFFHRAWPRDGLDARTLLTPFEALLKDRLQQGDPENQIASLFVRWAPAKAGIEAYGEFARNDHSANVRDVLAEPDHNSAYMVGLRRAWARRHERVVSVRAELLNARLTHLQRVRPQARFYDHTDVRQGHTQRGQALGSPAAIGGSGATVGVDVYGPSGRWSGRLDRLVRYSPWAEGSPLDSIDVLHTLRVERLRFARPADLRAGAALVYNANRNFADDAWSLRLDLGLRYGRATGVRVR